MAQRAAVTGSYFGWGTGAIALLALALRWPLPAPTWTHFDETLFIVLPLGFWGGDFNPHYFNYPTFHFYLNSFFYFLYFLVGSAESVEHFVAYHFLVDGRPLLALARGLNTLFSVATVVATACLGRRLYGVGEGLLAALVLATMPLAVRFAHLANTDTPAVFWIALALLWAVRARQQGQPPDYLVAGVCTGLAAATKYPAALVAVPVAVAILPGRRGYLGLAAGAALLSFALATPFVWLDATQFWAHFADMGQTHLLGGAGKEDQAAWLYHLRYTWRYGLGAVGLLAAGLSLVWALGQRRWQELVLLAAIVPFVAVLVVAESTFMRYALPLAPLLALLLGRLSGLVFRHRLLGGLSVLLLVAEPLYAALSTRILLAGPDTRRQAEDWIGAQGTQRLLEWGSPCGQLQLLTPGRVRVRQTHYLRSYGVQGLRRAYERLAQREDLPPFYLEMDELIALGRRADVPMALVRYRHPLCPEAAMPSQILNILEAGHWQEVFAPGLLKGAVFDRMDWYFVPVAGFGQIKQTGPIIEVGLLASRAAPERIGAAAYFAALASILHGQQAGAEGKWRQALRAYGRVLELSVAPEELLGVEMGRYLYAQMGRGRAQIGQYAEAVQYLQMAVALPPAGGDVYNELGAAYAASGALQKAVGTWEELIGLYPDFAPAYFNMGRALLRLGQNRRAHTYLRRALALVPDHPQAGQIQRLLENSQ